ncbi:hypothetical protein TFLX_01618 [Thermoflexales bacterium]|nr:hypothetical protein TFLX_01618 [Thermoflexales bacterium]
MKTTAELRERLSKTVKELITTCRQLPDVNATVYDGWSAKDILGHVTFWHESFARNVSDLVHDRQPTPLKGKLSDLNQQGVADLRPCSLEEVLGRLEVAQRIIHANILNPKLSLIPYRKGSRDYTPEEHLEIVAEHLQQHLKGLRHVQIDS